MDLEVVATTCSGFEAYSELDLRRSCQMEVGDQALGLAKLAATEQQMSKGFVSF